MRILAIEAAHRRPSAAALEDERVLAFRAGTAGGAASLAVLARAVLEALGWTSRDLDALAASVGPGSFTGIRAGLAFAAGFALVAHTPVIGVTTREAYASLVVAADERPLWVATDTRRRGMIYLERAEGAVSVLMEEVAPPGGPILLAGDAAAALAPFLRARGADVLLAATSSYDADALGRAALRLARTEAPLAPPVPLYVDPPAVHLPARARAAPG